MIVENFQIEEGKGKKALLINPPVYDFAYSNAYNQPDGLLRVATLLKKRGYEVALIDFLSVKKDNRIPFISQPENPRYKGMVRKHFGMSFEEFERELARLPFMPEEIYVTSIMTYWWESTRDVIRIVKQHFPDAIVFVGGVYPTLCSEHALENTGADIIVKGEIEEASNLWTDVTLYKKFPFYAIINFSRGCPFNCAYCAQRKLNGDGMRYRNVEDIVDEIESKNHMGIGNFWIFSDNFLIGDHFSRVLEEVVRRGLQIRISAPKGMEPRLLSRDLLELMRRAGWKTINMAIESANPKVREDSWNRRHNTNADFERAVRLASEYGFKHEQGGIVGFLLFGAPGEDIADVIDTAQYLHDRGVFIRPMPFTPVPGTQIFEKHLAYVEELGLKLEDLNEKLYPFAKLNGTPIQRYLSLHEYMYQLNTKLHKKMKVKLLGAEDLLNFKLKLPEFPSYAFGCAN